MTEFEQFQLATSVKLLAGKSNSDSYRSFYEEIETSRIHIKPEDILLLYSLIPTDVPTGNQIIVSYKGADTVIAEKVELILEPTEYDPDVFKSSSLINVIPHDYGNGYQWVLKDKNNEIIPFGLNQWIIDSYAGTLAFTAGFPSGYTTPITFTGWRYCGPVGLDNFLQADGSTPLVDNYEPINDMDISTKKYVDDSVGVIKDLAERLTPSKPDTFENKDLALLNESYPAYRVVDSTLFDKVVYDNSILRIQVPSFYKEDTGTLTVYVNKVSAGSVNLETVEDGSRGYFNIETVDAYKGVVGSEGFYNAVNLVLELPSVNFVSSLYPYLDVYLKYVGETTYESKHIVVGVDVPRNDTSIDTIYTSSIENPKYVSGVPCLTTESVVNISFKLSTLNYYRQDTIGESIIDTKTDILADNSYASYLPIITRTLAYTPLEDTFKEDFTLTINSFTSENKLFFSKSALFDLRIDTSDESTRLTSGEGLYPTQYGSTFDSEIPLSENTELQLYHNLYQYPTGDYTSNATSPIANGNWVAGPNYNLIEAGSPRYALFKFNLTNYCRGFYISILEPKNVGMNEDSKVYSNMTVQVLASGYTGWLDANKPYVGIGSPKENGEACLVVSKSNESFRYVTFGTQPIKGNVYVRVGMSDRNISFKNVKLDMITE